MKTGSDAKYNRFEKSVQGHEHLLSYDGNSWATYFSEREFVHHIIQSNTEFIQMFNI
jgi:hypothetical protein